MDYLAKIQAMLEKAERTDNEHERDAYQSKANELIAKWGIDVALLSKTQPTNEQIVEKRVAVTGIYAEPLVTLAHLIGKAMRTVDGFQTRRGKNRWYTFVGFASDVERAELLWTSLQLQSLTAMQRWWREYDESLLEVMTGMEKFIERRSFIKGFAQSSADKLAVMYRREATTAGTGTDLVLADRGQLVKKHLEDNYQLKASGGRSKITSGAYDGHRAGRNADVGAGRVGGAGGRNALGS